VSSSDGVSGDGDLDCSSSNSSVSLNSRLPGVIGDWRTVAYERDDCGVVLLLDNVVLPAP
jgi:hypothetical protein